MTFDQEFFDKTSGPLIECSKQASEEIIKIYESDEFEASDKDDGSPLTAADRASNEIISPSCNVVNVVGSLSDITYYKNRYFTLFILYLKN